MTESVTYTEYTHTKLWKLNKIKLKRKKKKEEYNKSGKFIGGESCNLLNVCVFTCTVE